MIRRIAAVAAAALMAGGIGLAPAAQAVTASPNPLFEPAAGSPSYPPGAMSAVTPGSTPLSDIACSASVCFPLWMPNQTVGWHDHGAGGYLNNTAVDDFGGVGHTWQEYRDMVNGLCATYNSTTNGIYGLTCGPTYPNAGYKSSQQWASSPVSGQTYAYYSWNLYIKQTNPNSCGNTYAPVITASSSSSYLYMICPEGGPTTYTRNQQWQWSWSG